MLPFILLSGNSQEYEYQRDSIPSQSLADELTEQITEFLNEGNYYVADSLASRLKNHLPDIPDSVAWEKRYKYQYTIGNSRRLTEQHFAAIKYYKNALSLHTSNSGDACEHRLDALYSAMAETVHSMEIYTEAVKYTRKSHQVTKKCDRPFYFICFDYENLARLHYYIGDKDSTLFYLDKLKQSLGGIKNPEFKSYMTVSTHKSALNFYFAYKKTEELYKELQDYIEFCESQGPELYEENLNEIRYHKAFYYLKQRNKKAVDTILSKMDLPLSLHSSEDNARLNFVYILFLAQEHGVERALNAANKIIGNLPDMNNYKEWLVLPHHLQLNILFWSKVEVFNEAILNDEFAPLDTFVLHMSHFRTGVRAFLEFIDNSTYQSDYIYKHGNNLRLGIDMTAHYYQKYKDDKNIQQYVWDLTSQQKSISFRHSARLKNYSHIDDVPENILERKDRYLKAIYNYNKKVHSTRDWKKKPEILDSLKRTYFNILDTLEQRYPNYYKVKYKPNYTTLEQAKHFAKKHNLQILNLSIGHDYVIAQLIDGDSVSTHTGKLHESWEDDLNTVIDISRYGRGVITSEKEYRKYLNEYSGAANRLYDAILSSSNLSDSKNIIVLSTPQLKGLDLSQLINNEVSNPSSFSELDFLIDRYNFSYTNVVDFLDDGKKEISSDILYVNPNYEKNASILPSHKDIQSVNRNFKISALISDEATKESFLDKVSNSSILHFSGHSVVNSQRPELSYLLFSGSNSLENKLHAKDIYNLKIPAELVFLNACTTLGDKAHVSEGMIGLSRAFRFAGVKSIVSSRWNIKDRETREFTKLFYENLSSGETVSQAVRNGKLSFRNSNDPILSHPYFWAGFISHDQAFKTLKTSHSNYLWLIIALVALGLVGFLLWKINKS